MLQELRTKDVREAARGLERGLGLVLFAVLLCFGCPNGSVCPFGPLQNAATCFLFFGPPLQPPRKEALLKETPPNRLSSPPKRDGYSTVFDFSRHSLVVLFQALLSGLNGVDLERRNVNP